MFNNLTRQKKHKQQGPSQHKAKNTMFLFENKAQRPTKWDKRVKNYLFAVFQSIIFFNFV